jgi:hypothetical protein
MTFPVGWVLSILDSAHRQHSTVHGNALGMAAQLDLFDKQRCSRLAVSLPSSTRCATHGSGGLWFQVMLTEDRPQASRCFHTASATILSTKLNAVDARQAGDRLGFRPFVIVIDLHVQPPHLIYVQRNELSLILPARQTSTA